MQKNGNITLSDVGAMRTKYATYEVGQEIGHGGSGYVYEGVVKAIHTAYPQRKDEKGNVLPPLKKGDKVAIKTIKPDLFSEKARKRIENEMKLGAKLNHQSIIPIVDTTELRGYYVLVSPFVDGLTLDKWFANNQGDINTLRNVLIKIFEALNYLHKKGLIHRDLKPANIVVRRDGSVVILDLGIAKKVADTDDGITVTYVHTGQNFIGTIKYASPEQMTNPQSVGPKSDIFGIGATLYDLCTGKPIMETSTRDLNGRHPFDIAAFIRDKKYLKPRKINKRLPKFIEALILEMIAHSSNSRPSAYQCIQILKAMKIKPGTKIWPQGKKDTRVIQKTYVVKGSFIGRWFKRFMWALVFLVIIAGLWFGATYFFKPEWFKISVDFCAKTIWPNLLKFGNWVSGLISQIRGGK